MAPIPEKLKVPDGQIELLPRVARAVGEPGRRGQRLVGAGAQPRQPGGQLAGPPLDASELGARGGAGVDGDRRRQRAGLSQSVCTWEARGATLA